MALSRKQRAFVDEYLHDFNATQAAIRAGYSEKTARSIGHENLTKPDIAAEIDKRVSERTMSANEALIRLAEQARAEYAQFITRTGEIDFAGLKIAGKMHLIKAIKETAHGQNIEFHDAQAALRMIAQAHGLFESSRGTEDDPLHIAVQAIDYRDELTSVAPGPIPDSSAPSEDEGA